MKSPNGKRTYRQTTRAVAAEVTGERILDAFAERMRQSWLDEIRLEDVAAAAEVTVQTVIRRFGGKDGLLGALCERSGREIRIRRAVSPGDVDSAIRVLAEDYETVGELILRFLAQEDRYPALKGFTDVGRAGHRQWVEATFAPWLDRLTPMEARRVLDALVVAMDVYVWALLRRDMRRSIVEYQNLVRSFITAVLAGAPAKASLTFGHHK